MSEMSCESSLTRGLVVGIGRSGNRKFTHERPRLKTNPTNIFLRSFICKPHTIVKGIAMTIISVKQVNPAVNRMKVFLLIQWPPVMSFPSTIPFASAPAFNCAAVSSAATSYLYAIGVHWNRSAKNMLTRIALLIARKE